MSGSLNTGDVSNVKNVSFLKKVNRESIVQNFSVSFLLLLTATFFLLVAVIVPGTQRGFYCDDNSITKPYVENQTVSTALCAVLSLAMVFGSVVLVDFHNILQFCRRSRASTLKKSVIQRYLIVSTQCVVFLACGAFIERTVLDLTKKTVGELRPNFISICFPDRTEYFNICKSESFPTNFVYTDCPNGISQHLVDEARLSFPSGHSSFIFLGAVSAIIYIKSQLLVKRGCFKMFSVAVQIACFVLAWWVAITRVKDYWHHPRDVLTGALIGTALPLFIWRVSPLKKKRKGLLQCYEEDERGDIHGGGDALGMGTTTHATPSTSLDT